jgi:TRAP-type C4-dicarboxylate transport system substrate-binding protein
MKRIVAVLFISVFMVTALAACAPAATAPKPGSGQSPTPNPAPAKAIELKFAHFQPTTAYVSINFLEPWAKKIEAACKGAVKVTVYPAETLCKEKETVPGVETGIADIGWISEGNIKGRFPVSEVTGLSFQGLTRGKDPQSGQTLGSSETNSLIFWDLYNSVPAMQKEHSSVKVLFVHATESFYIYTAKKPVRNLDDLKGQKIRVSAGVLADTVKLLGASPVTLSFPETYDAAQKGVIDGQAANIGHLINGRLYEIWRYKTDIYLCNANQFSMIMNLDKWNKLPKEVQDGIMSVSGKEGALMAGRDGYGPGMGLDLEKAMKAGNYKIEEIKADPGEEARWQDAAGKPQWDKWISDMEAKGLPGRDTFAKLQEITNKYRVK